MNPIIFFLLCHMHIVTCLNFKIVVVIEQSAANSTLVDLAVRRRVNSNWRVFPGHTMSHVTVEVPENGMQFASRQVCSQANISALITVGNCGMVTEMSLLARSLQLPSIALPTELCYPHQNVGFSATGSHPADAMIDGAVAAMASIDDAKQVAIFYDSVYNGPILQRMQSGLSATGSSSITVNFQTTMDPPHLKQLSLKLKSLRSKRKTFYAIVIATASNTMSILNAAVNAGALKQNYFWLIIDSGLSKSQLMSVCPTNCNLALLRGGTTGVNEAGGCSSAVRDVFEECDTDRIRTLDVRIVDAVETLAKAFATSMLQVSFQPSNASCFPLQPWSSGTNVLDNILSLSGYETGRGIISYNSKTGFFNTQGLEIVASFTERVSDPVKFVLSAQFSNNTLTKIFHKRSGASYVFPNTFTGFGFATLVVCSPIVSPVTTVEYEFPNGTFVIGGLTGEILNYLSAELQFKYQAKRSDDGTFGAPIPGSDFYSGCVGELQRGQVHLAAGPFTKTSGRDSKADFSTELFEESHAILIPKPKPQTKMWDAFLPLDRTVWIVLLVSILVAAFIVWMLAIFSPFSAINLGLKGALSDEGSYMEYTWTIIGSFMLQGQEFYPYALSPRIALASWWCFTVIIYSAYTAVLASTLTTITTINMPIKTLADFVAQTDIRPAARLGTSSHTLLRSATSGIYQQLAENLLDSADRCPDLALNGTAACISDYSLLASVALAHCTKVYVLDEVFNPGSVAFMYPEDSYYADNMDQLLRRFREKGQMQRLYSKYFLEAGLNSTICEPSSSQASNADPIGLETVSGCLIVTGALYAVGFLILIAELLISALYRRFSGRHRKHNLAKI